MEFVIIPLTSSVTLNYFFSIIALYGLVFFGIAMALKILARS